MKKETFIKAIEAIESQIRFDIEVSKKLGEAFPNADTANLLPDNHFVSNALMEVLQEQMNDNEICRYGQSWIEWFCFETDFGNESYRLQAFDENKQPIKMANASDLYDFLIKVYEHPLQNAIDTYGKTRQTQMIQEECLELALAIQKYQREQSYENYNRIIDEIADVKIMIEQSQIIFPIDKINERVEFKMNRLNERLKEEKLIEEESNEATKQKL